jgi:hypothetical protein
MWNIIECWSRFTALRKRGALDEHMMDRPDVAGDAEMWRGGYLVLASC